MRVLPISVVVVLGLVLLPVPATEVASASAAAPVASAPQAITDPVSLGKLRTLLQDPHEAAELSFTAPFSAKGLLGKS